MCVCVCVRVLKFSSVDSYSAQRQLRQLLDSTMAPKALKSMKAKSMKAASANKALTRVAIIKEIAIEAELKNSKVSEIFDILAAIASAALKKNKVFTIPRLCRIKTKTKPATKAGTRTAKTVITATPLIELKNEVLFPN